ncbi:UBE2T (predicted) [Pycnogonum litorale]
MNNVRSSRLKKEIQQLKLHPPPSVSCCVSNDRLDKFEAVILGAKETPYDGGAFKIEVILPDRYPFEPPKLKFLTPIYHPNIDSAGRICLDVLKMPPQGGWKPSLNLSSVLLSIQLLMTDPNPDDPLMIDIAQEFKYKYSSYEDNARTWTKTYASHEGRSNVVGTAENIAGGDKMAECKVDESDSSKQRTMDARGEDDVGADTLEHHRRCKLGTKRKMSPI